MKDLNAEELYKLYSNEPFIKRAVDFRVQLLEQLVIQIEGDFFIPKHHLTTWWKYGKFHHRIFYKCPSCKKYMGCDVIPLNTRELFCTLHGIKKQHIFCQNCGLKWNPRKQ